MTIEPMWLPPIAGIVGGGAITIIWLIMKRGWARDIARERAAQAEWDRTHAAK